MFLSVSHYKISFLIMNLRCPIVMVHYLIHFWIKFKHLTWLVQYETAHLNVHSLSRNTCNLNVTTATTTTVTTAITSAIYNYHWQFLIFHQNSLLNWWIYIIIVYKQGVTHNDKKGSHVTNKQNSQISLSLHFTYYYQHSLPATSFLFLFSYHRIQVLPAVLCSY